MKQIIYLSIRLSVAGSLLAYLVLTKKLDFSGTWCLLRKPEIVGPTLLLLLATTFLAAHRWLLLLRCVAEPPTPGSTLRLTFIGNFFNFGVPGGVGGDLVKTYYLVKRNGVQTSGAISSVVVDRFLGTSVLIGIGVLSLLLSRAGGMLQNGALGTFWQTLVFAFAAGVPLLWWALVRSKTPVGANLLARLPGNWGSRLSGVRDALLAYREHKGVILLAVLESLAIHSCVIGAFWFLGQALGAPQLHWLHFSTLVPLGLLTMAVPLAPAGIGVSHVAFFTLFSMVGFSRGGDLFSVYLFCQLGAALPGLFFYLIQSPKPVTSRPQ